MTERCGWYHRNGARCRNGATALVERPSNIGSVNAPETVTVPYCALHVPEIQRLVGGKIVADTRG
jgi:hypothetical protein